jgi:signal transduction histidine kinase
MTAQNTAEHAAPAVPAGRPRVLLVDDEPDVARTVSDILRQEPCDVDVVAGAADALAALAGRPYDVLLTELRLTRSDGLHLLDEVRRRPAAPYCIVLTGYASLESAVAALRRGAYDYLVKPCVIEDLKQTVRRAVAQRRLTLLAAQRERELKELNDQLEARVAERTAALTEANRRLEEANATKDRFLATLSHELRTPLTPLRAGLDLLRERGGEEVLPVVEAMERNLAQETRLIDDLLDIARISAGKLSVDKRGIDLEACLRAAAEMIRPRAQARAQALAVEVRSPLPTLLADPVRLQQVVANLLDNAVKFAPRQGRVELTAWRQGDEVVVEVRDDGPGIPPDFLPHVFEPFRQADSSSRRQHGGIGLGLAIARQIARLHQGELSAANRSPGPGACFTFRFPLVPAALEPPRPAPARTSAGLRLLLVDDSTDTVEMIARLLCLRGLSVRTANSAAAALEHARAEPPGVVITDIGMPGQDGYDLLRALRAEPRLSGVPVIAATGYVGSQEQEQMAQAGFAATLSKPFDLAELLVTLDRVVRAAEAPNRGQ